MKYWLMKSEPSVYGIDDLVRDGVTGWEGVRNFQARNFMRDEMKVGDVALFYHSNANPPGVAGIMQVVREAYADDTAEDPNSSYFDAKWVAAGKPNRWVRVDLKLLEKFPREVSLQELREDACLVGLMVTRKGVRLSIQPVDKKHFLHICRLGGATIRP